MEHIIVIDEKLSIKDKLFTLTHELFGHAVISQIDPYLGKYINDLKERKKKMKKLILDNEMILIDALINKLGYTHKKAKTLLTNKLVLVNSKVITKYNHNLKINDEIEIRTFNNDSISNDIEILYEDKDIIVVSKPHNLLTISSENEHEKTLYHMVSNYVKSKNKNARIFIVHRLDKETSGIVLFAKTEKVKKMYQDNWNKLVKYRGYVAVIEGNLEKQKDTITLKMKENDNFKVYVDRTGKEAITKYEVIRKNSRYSLLDIQIKTGRKNQIRVTMEFLKHPIVGDSKYSSKDRSINRLALHAYKLILINPLTNKEMKFELNIPKEFYNITK